jgi:ParB-like chromosome segregation protein Spo0J
MATSIRNEGVINDIEIDERFIIITGEQRWRAAKLAGLKEIPVKMIKGIKGKERFIRQVQENIHHNTMSPLETAEALDKIRRGLLSSAQEVKTRKDHKPNLKGVAELNKLLGTRKSTLIEYLDLLGETKEIKNLLRVKGFARGKVQEIKYIPSEYRGKIRKFLVSQPNAPRELFRAAAAAVSRAVRYGEKDKADKILSEKYDGLTILEMINKINKIVPTEEDRIKEPSDVVKAIGDKTIELLEILEEHPLISLDDLHKGLVTQDIVNLGQQLAGYLKPRLQLK